MIESGNNGNGFQFRSDAGAKIYGRVMKTSTGNRLASYSGIDYERNFNATHALKQDIDALCDSMLMGEGETFADTYTFPEKAVVYFSGISDTSFESAVQWANVRAKKRLEKRKTMEVDAKLEGLVGHCTRLTSNCDAVLAELDERIDTVTHDFYSGIERARNLKTVLAEYEGRIEEIGDGMPECTEKEYRKRLELQRELSGLKRDQAGVVAELDDATFKVQMGKKELDELDNTASYLAAVRANNIKSEQRFSYLLAQARRKQYNLSPLIIDAEALVDGDNLAKEQGRTDAIYSKVMNKVVELITATFGTQVPPSKSAVKEFMKMRKDEIERVKKEFEGLFSIEQERLDRLLA